MFAEPLTPPAVAVIVADPAALPVTWPLCDTDAAPGSDEFQETDALSGFPLASSGVAVSCCVCPTPIVPELGVTETDATTGGVTFTVALPVFPPALAVIVADPTAFAVATPLDETETALGFDVDQLTAIPLIALPEASREEWRSGAGCDQGKATRSSVPPTRWRPQRPTT